MPLHQRIDSLDEVRDLARQGELATALGAADPTRRRQLARTLYVIVWPVVFQHLTRKMELRRGHVTCALSVRHLADECLDRFHDDVEAVIDDIAQRAVHPVDSLEAWIASRLIPATVDGHRRRRGEFGALQRPRLPKWLVHELHGDEWLTELAVQMLNWVGTPARAGTHVWPTEAWAVRRCERTGDWSTLGSGDVHRDITTVIQAMRRRPQWYERYVETPLGRKQAPVALTPHHADGVAYEPSMLSLTDTDAVWEASLRRLAHEAVALIAARLRRGEPARTVVTEVVRSVFGDGVPASDVAPHGADDTHVLRMLRDPSAVDRIVEAALSIVEDGG